MELTVPILYCALELQVVADGLDDVLAVVEHAFDGDVVDVLVLQAEHLRLLEGAHAAVRAGHEHADALLAAHGVFGRAAGVAAGGAQDVQLVATAAPVRIRTGCPAAAWPCP